MKDIKSALRSNTQSFPFILSFVTIITLGAVWLQFSYHWWLLSIFVYFCTGCLGITVTFHRFLSHKSFRMHKGLEYLFSFFGAMGGTGSSIGWVAVHLQHHKYSDTEFDPHSPQHKGLNIFLGRYTFDFNRWQVRHLITDKFHILMHNYYHLWLLLWALLWLAIDMRFFVFVVAVPISFQFWASNLSNWGNHSIGYRNFETHEHSTNSLPLALITWGEGWHNNHHRYPGRPSFKINWWEIDPSAWVIKLIQKGRISKC